MAVSGETIRPCVALGKKPDDCWQWIGHVSGLGYPYKSYLGKTIPARRWLWEQLFGPVPDKLIVTTSCQNTTCMNPHHFVACELGEAARDGLAATLTPKDVFEIKAAKKDHGPTVAQHLAEKFGVHRQSIYDIWNGRTWRRPGKKLGPFKHQPPTAAPMQQEA